MANMSKEKISSQDIIDLLAVKASVSKKSAEEFLKSLFATIEDALVAGDQVKIKGFGTFKSQWNEPRKSVNVQTGEEFVIDGFFKVTFVPETGLKELVNEPFSFLEPVVLDENNEPVKITESEVTKPIVEDKPVTVETAVTPVSNEAEEPLEALKIFTEQADEIKGLLSEINSMSSPKEKSKPVDANIDRDSIPDYFSMDDEEDEDDDDAMNEEPDADVESLNEPEISAEYVAPENAPAEVISEPEKPIEAPVEEAAENILQTEELGKSLDESKTMDEDVAVDEQAPVVEEESKDEVTDMETKSVEQPASRADMPTIVSTPDPFTSRVKKKRRRLRAWMLIVIVLFVSVIGFGINYYFSSATRCWCEYSLFSDSNKQKIDNFKSTIAGWFGSKPKAEPQKKVVAKVPAVVKDTTAHDTVVAPKAAPQAKAKVDSLQILFDQPRVYKEFIGSEKINEGSRLTTISEKYYGAKDFWVYIYEANKAKIANPDKVPVGITVKIPKMDKRLVDKTNPRCLVKARQLHDLYVGKKK